MRHMWRRAGGNSVPADPPGFIIDTFTTTGSIAGIDGLTLLVAGFTVIVASVLRAFSGFGFALAAMPLLVLVVEPANAVVLCTVLALVAALRSFRRAMGEADRGALRPLLLGSLIGTPLGVYALDILPAQTIELLIGIGVLASAFFLWRSEARSGGAPHVALPVGFTAGLMGGALGIPGPPVVIYLLRVQGDARVARATLMMFFNVSCLISLVGYGVSGNLWDVSPALIAMGVPCLLIGDGLGFYLFERFGGTHHRHISLVALAFAGAVALINALG